MPSTVSLIDRIRREHADLTLVSGERFEWQPGTRTIAYDPDDPQLEPHLLHELAHALLEHSSYDRDIDLIAMERDAWQKAKIDLGPSYDVEVPSDLIHHDMDTYRDWLHERSTCPHCGSNGIQIKQREYKCVTCLKTWRVNEARSCQLRRYTV